MRKRISKLAVLILVVFMMLVNTMPVFAATSAYGEDKPLTTVTKSYYIETSNGNSHKHWYIDANNGNRYFLYDSCMDGMVGTTPTNHSSTVTIDGVKYTLCNYGYKNKSCSYANVIKKVSGASTGSAAKPESSKTPAKKIALQKIALSRATLNVNVGNTGKISVSYYPSNTTDNKKVTWSSSNTSVAAVSDGKVTAKKPGTATITAKVGSRKESCKVTVKAPLKSISLNKTSASVTAGNSVKLSVTYNPGNTTDSKTVKWTSSNTSIATVSGGTVTAKKAGTVTITAKVGSKTATCKVTVKAASSGGSSSTGSQTSNGSYKNVSDAYTLLNNFRTSKENQWYWNPDNTTKTTTYGLKGLSKDSALEKVAKVRAKEQWIMYYERGMLTHNRPDGSRCFTAYPSGMCYVGENLAWGQSTCRSVITDPGCGWAETNYKYSGQGHRRNMLDRAFTKVGIACYVKDGKTCWAMCLGN